MDRLFLKKDLRRFPDGVKKVVGFSLAPAQEGGKHFDAEPLEGFGGAGVLEVVQDHAGDTYRAVYTELTRDSGALHGASFSSEAQLVPLLVTLDTLEDVEKRPVRATLERCDWRIRGAGEAAEVLNVKPTTLEARMKKLGVSRPTAPPKYHDFSNELDSYSSVGTSEPKHPPLLNEYKPVL